MKILFLDFYYESFLKDFYAKQPQLAKSSYDEQKRALLDSCFGTSDFYSRNLAALGWDADHVIVNCLPLQVAWVRENFPRLRVPIGLAKRSRSWTMGVVDEQIRRARPDVLYIEAVTFFDESFIRHQGDQGHMIVGQVASRIDWTFDFDGYDLVISSLPNFVQRFRQGGVSSEYLALGFEPSVLKYLRSSEPKHDLSFVGSLGAVHKEAWPLLEHMARTSPIVFWGYDAETLPPPSPIHSRYRGRAWGLEMYSLISSSRVVLNRHADYADQFANNMRLFEATGVGTCLLTEEKQNLEDFFEVDHEVVAYSGIDECLEKALYLLAHEKERKMIAAAGQIRTLADHTYAHRMEELHTILDGYLRRNLPKRSDGDRVRRWATWRGFVREGFRKALRSAKFLFKTPQRPYNS